MIRFTATVESTIPAELTANGLTDSYRQLTQDVFQDTRDEIDPFLLAELRVMPGKVKYPIEWTPGRDGEDNQRKAFFATNGFGNGIPYQRTGKLANAWETSTRTAGDDLAFVVNNRASQAQYVYGSLAKSNPGRFQQRFHRNTGWQKAFDTVQFWMQAFGEKFRDNLQSRLGDLAGALSTRTRAFTRGKRR